MLQFAIILAPVGVNLGTSGATGTRKTPHARPGAHESFLQLVELATMKVARHGRQPLSD
jgi:hypothetical protein